MLTILTECYTTIMIASLVCIHSIHGLSMVYYFSYIEP